MSRAQHGSVVLVDWRIGSLPKEPNKLRPAIVVEDSQIFVADHPNVIVVPLTSDEDFAIPALSVIINPTPQNGCTKRSFALAFNVTSVSHQRIKRTTGAITPRELEAIRTKIGICLGIV